MVAASQLIPAMTIKVDNTLFRVESSVKVTAQKATPFIKTKLRNLETGKSVEKNFKPNQDIEEVKLKPRSLEFLYKEGKNYLFIDIENLEKILAPASVVGDKINYLKEATEIKAYAHDTTLISLELPQFLELMVVGIDTGAEDAGSATTSKIAELETGARIEVPPFIEVGDIIKVDTELEEYIQRV